jgi:hypothetical protein
MEILALITGIIKLIPVIKDAFEKLVAYYIGTQIESMKAENLSAVRLAMSDYDQRKIEEALGSSHAGKPVDMQGSEIRSHIVGIPPSN